MTERRVAIVSLGRDAAMGEVRRVASWRLIFEQAGAVVEHVPLEVGIPIRPEGALAVARGDAVPERLAWSGHGLRRALDGFGPSVVLVVSARAFDPAVTELAGTVILDFVDSLGRNYRDRADLTSGLRRVGYRMLATAHRRVERRLTGKHSLHCVAAGWADARRLDVEWVPNVADPALHPETGRSPDHDVLFVGTLRYPPNIDTLERLALLWPEVQQLRPGTTALVAGAAPPDRVRRLCARNGWSLEPDFASFGTIAARARVAVAPLTRTAGIQNKVLDAAAVGLPQVVRSPALDGLDPDFPLTPCDDDGAFASELVRLLDDGDAAARQADRTLAHVVARYSVDRWAAWARTAAG